MGFPPILGKLILLMMLSSLHCRPLLAQVQLEKDALYALKANFNDPLLDFNWLGPHCPSRWYGITCLNGRVNGIILEGLGLRGIIGVDAFYVFTELTTLSFKNNLISGEVMNFSSNVNIRKLDLSGNNFQGLISPSLMSLDSLESLQLQDNSLTGPVPAFNQSTLKVFNVSGNNLDGEIPKTYVLQSLGFDSYSNNPELCGPPTNISCNSRVHMAITSDNNTATSPTSEPEGSPSRHSSAQTIFLLFDFVGLAAVILLFILYFRKTKRLQKILKKHGIEEEERSRQRSMEEGKESMEDDDDDIGLKEESSMNVLALDSHQKDVVVAGEGNLIFLEKQARFELNDLLKASAEGLGKGIFGNSYKATLDGMPPVVVKRLGELRPLTIEEFMRQLSRIAEQKHPNLLPLVAYYYSKEEKLIVSKFAEKGNLFNRIHGGRGSKERIPFRWNSRLAVARGVARALEYLHLNNSNAQSIVPHGNLKSSNVLFDENEMVLVSDYGLSSLLALPIASNRLVSSKSTEHQIEKRVSRKSDVWSYGCLILELLTGRAPAHSAPPGTSGVDLCSWVFRAVREEWTAEILDIEISVQRSSTAAMLKLLKIAMRCCDRSPEKRPEMTEVVREVDNIKVDESEDEDLSSSLDQSLTDESHSTSASGIIVEEKIRKY